MKLLRDTTVVAIACFFAVMWGLLISERISSVPGAQVTPRYDKLLPVGEKRREFRMGIYLGSVRLGQTRTIIERSEEGTIYLQNTTRLDPGGIAKLVLPLSEPVDVNFYAHISPLRGLRSFRASSETIALNLVGSVEDGRMSIKGRLGNEKIETTFPFHGFLGEMFSPTTGLPRLHPGMVGQTWSMQVVNPILGRVDVVKVRVHAYKDLHVEGKKTRAFLLFFFMGAKKEWYTWVDADGEVLIQGTPFLVYLVRDGLPPELVSSLLKEVPYGQHGSESPGQSSGQGGR